MLTYQCNAACKECGTFSSPRDKNSITLDTCIKSITEARKLGFGNIVFTGGEATLELDKLLKGIAHAVSLEFPVRLVTNAHWATSLKAAENFVSALKKAGLVEINFSTGDEHAKFIDPLFTAYASIAAINAGLRTVLVIEMQDSSFKYKDIIIEKVCSLSDQKNYEKLFKVIESPWMPVKWTKPAKTGKETLTNLSNLFSRGGCDSVLQTYVVQGDGKIAACCGLGMRGIKELHTGSTHQLQALNLAVNNAEQDWLKIGLKFIGPERILAWASTKNTSILWENMYSHRCHACIRIYKDEVVRQVIKEYFHEIIPDILASSYIELSILPNLATIDNMLSGKNR